MTMLADAPRVNRDEIWQALMHRDPCPVCKDDPVGYLYVNDLDVTDCPCAKLRPRLRNYDKLLTELGDLHLLNGDLNRKPFIDLDPKIQAIVRGFAKNIGEHVAAGRGLWFQGQNGNSKTSTAVGLLKQAWDAGQVPAFQTVPHILHLMRQTFEGEQPTSDYLALLRRVVRVSVLVLDDLGAGAALTPWAQEKVYEIVNGSVQEMDGGGRPRSLIVTTNRTPEQLEEEFGPAVVSRLYQLCGKPIVFTGDDWRRKLATDWSEVYPPADAPPEGGDIAVSRATPEPADS